MFNYLLLYGVKQLKGQRTTASLYHIISGRRSTQTIQDAHFYQMTQFYSIYQKLKRAEFDQAISNLIEQDDLIIDDAGVASLTLKSEQTLNARQQPKIINAFNGIESANKAKVFSDRLALTIQTFANRSIENNQFQPINEDLAIQQWVRSYYQSQQDIKSWLMNTYQHLTTFLATIDEKQATIFVNRLSGYRNYGQTIQQLAMKHNLSNHDVHLILAATYHQLIDYIETNQVKLLAQFIPEQQQQTKKFITQSAQQTNRLLNQGYTIDQIIDIRRLKRSTIEDHIVELAYAIPNLNLSNYFKSEDLNEILEEIKQINDLRLSQIKQQIGDRYSYFQIRLAIARASH